MTFRIILIATMMLLSGCATTTQNTQRNPDPFEQTNRELYAFNMDVLDKYLLKPTTQVYVYVTPQLIRSGLVNVAENLQEPENILNSALQGNVHGTMVSFSRFFINSTVGLLGLFDIAGDYMALPAMDEDFGQTLAVYGVNTGPYLMVPALGPSDPRSLTGRAVDSLYWPSTVLETPITLMGTFIRVLEARASLIEQEQTLNNAIDPYIFVRDAYFQRLDYKVNNGQVTRPAEEEAMMDAFDDLDFDELNLDE